MQYEMIHNKEIQQIVLHNLELNDGYCPSIPDSKGIEEYKCICDDFKYNTDPGDLCRCMLYKKISN